MSKFLFFLCVLSLALSTTAFAQDAPVTDCDTYAGSDQDPQRKTAGMPLDRINPALAVPACEAALRQYPNSNRLAFQLGRALHKANNFATAVAQYRKAADQGYAIAQNNLGGTYENGLGVAKDYAQAVAWYRKAAAQGIELAQANLKRLSAQDTAGPPASADQGNWFETYVVAHGGCSRMGAYPDMIPGMRSRLTATGMLDIDLFGKPVIKWSDDDIARALRVFHDCEVRDIAAATSGLRADNPQKTFIFKFWATKEKMFETGLRDIIMTARNIDSQEKAQKQGKIDLEKAQAERRRAQAEEEAERKEQELRAQAQRDKEAADEARRFAEREEPKVAEATKEAEEARRALQDAKQRLAEIRSSVETQQQARQQSLAEKQELERQTSPTATKESENANTAGTARTATTMGGFFACPAWAPGTSVNGFTELVWRQVEQGRCFNIERGSQVRVDTLLDDGHVCVAPIGSSQQCQWTVNARSVLNFDTRDSSVAASIEAERSIPSARAMPEAEQRLADIKSRAESGTKNTFSQETTSERHPARGRETDPYIYLSVMKNTMPTIAASLGQVETACGAVSRNEASWDLCARAVDVALSNLRTLQSQMSDLVVPNCLGNVDRILRHALEQLERGYSMTRDGITSRNIGVVSMGAKGVESGNQELHDDAQLLKSIVAADTCTAERLRFLLAALHDTTGVETEAIQQKAVWAQRELQDRYGKNVSVIEIVDTLYEMKGSLLMFPGAKNLDETLAMLVVLIGEGK